jgi:hypothetical protein
MCERAKQMSELCAIEKRCRGLIWNFALLGFDEAKFIAPRLVPPCFIERRASLANIHISTSCMCNPGAASELLELSDFLAGFKFRKSSYCSDTTVVVSIILPFCTSSASQPKSLLASSTPHHNTEDQDYPTATSCTYAVNDAMERLIKEEEVVRVSSGLGGFLSLPLTLTGRSYPSFKISAVVSNLPIQL